MTIDTASLKFNAYLQDILDQPRALRETLNALAFADLETIQAFSHRLNQGNLRRVVLTGMGSSYQALHPTYLRLIAQGINVQRIETSELLHHAPALITPDSLVVMVSQSGRSVEITQLLDRANGRVPVIAVTNSADSPLALQAKAGLLTQAGNEATVSCKTYTSALAALEVLSRVLLGGETGSGLNALAAAPEAVERYLSGWEAHVQEASDRLEGIRYLVFAGRGPSLAAVGTGSLIIKEAARFPTEGMSSAAFRHGPFEMISPEMFLLVYEGDGPAAKLNAGLCRDVRAAGGRSGLVAYSEQAGLFSLPHSAGAVLPILEILPAQMFSLALALMNGHAPGVFQRATKITTAE